MIIIVLDGSFFLGGGVQEYIDLDARLRLGKYCLHPGPYILVSPSRPSNII